MGKILTKKTRINQRGKVVEDNLTFAYDSVETENKARRF